MRDAIFIAVVVLACGATAVCLIVLRLKWVTRKQLRYRIFDMRCLLANAIELVCYALKVEPVCPRCGHRQSRIAQEAHEKAPELLMKLQEQANKKWNEYP